VIALFVLSLIIDIAWLIFISWKTWNSEVYLKLAKWEKGIHNSTTIMVFINFVLKVTKMVFKGSRDSWGIIKILKGILVNLALEIKLENL
jgi:hypothetical protein